MAGKRVSEGSRVGESQTGPVITENRLRLAQIVTPRIRELGLTRKRIEKISGVSVSTIREIEHPKEPRAFSHEVLESLSVALEWAPDHLVRVAYPSSSEAPDLIVQNMMTALTPYLQKIDAIPGLQEDVSAIKTHLGIKVDIIHKKDDGPTTIVNAAHTHLTE